MAAPFTSTRRLPEHGAPAAEMGLPRRARALPQATVVIPFDFEVVVTAGVVLQRWTDPTSSTGKPSRVRFHPGSPQLYWLGNRGVAITIQAIVGGVTGPADIALGGRLFSPFMTEGFGPPIFDSSVGLSSILRWTPTNPGHHVIGIRRPGGGARLLHFDIGS